MTTTINIRPSAMSANNHKHKPIEHVISPWDEEPISTICHTHRLAWREADRLRADELKRLIEIAYDQGVRMDRKLKMYRKRFMKLDEMTKLELVNYAPE
jgi:hypothetical protein